MKHLLLALILSSCAHVQPAQAKTFTLENEDRLISVIDVVDSTAIKLAQKMDKLSQESSEPITMLINSPGGYISPGFMLVDAMEMAKKRGVTIKCVSGVLAASMAFIMLAHCDERYVLNNTLLLFHPVRFGGDAIRIKEVLPSLLETERREKRVDAYLMKKMGLGWRAYHPHSYSETSWSGAGLADYTSDASFLTVVDRVEGIPNLFVYRRKRFSLFGRSDDLLKTIPEAVRHLYGVK